jgi:hypothetical protein
MDNAAGTLQCHKKQIHQWVNLPLFLLASGVIGVNYVQNHPKDFPVLTKITAPVANVARGAQGMAMGLLPVAAYFGVELGNRCKRNGKKESESEGNNSGALVIAQIELANAQTALAVEQLRQLQKSLPTSPIIKLAGSVNATKNTGGSASVPDVFNRFR